MANPTVGWGFRPVRNFLSSAGNFQTNTRQIAYNYATAIGFGDAVIPLSTGYIALATATDTPIQGIFAGCRYINPNAAQGQQITYSKNWPGVSLGVSTIVVTAFVYDDPNIVFEVRNSSAATPITEADLGINAKLVAGTVNSAGISTQTLDQATIATTPTFPFRIQGLSRAVNNDNTIGNNLVYVTLNAAALNTPTGT